MSTSLVSRVFAAASWWGCIIGGAHASFTITEEDVALREGEDVNAAVDRVLERMMKDSENTKAEKRYKEVSKPNKYNENENDAYFKGYEDQDLHRQMIQDSTRTLAYKRAIEENASIIGKTVVDFGCGSGILSIFAARAGATKVYCVEKSKVRERTKQIIADNDLDDFIEVVTSIEDVPADSADVMVSEFMGYMMLTEDVLGDFLAAKDRVLKEDGILIPSSGSLYIQPVADPVWWKQNVQWVSKNDFDIDFKALLPAGKELGPIRFGHWGTFKTQKLLGKRQPFCEIDFETDVYDKDWVCGKRKRNLQWSGVPDSWTGWLITWDVKLYADVSLSTAAGPHSSYTHWGHVFWPRPYATTLGNGLIQENVSLSAMIKRSGGYYHDIVLDYVYGQDRAVEMKARHLTADELAVEDASQTARMYTGMLALKKQEKEAAKKANSQASSKKKRRGGDDEL